MCFRDPSGQFPQFPFRSESCCLFRKGISSSRKARMTMITLYITFSTKVQGAAHHWKRPAAARDRRAPHLSTDVLQMCYNDYPQPCVLSGNADSHHPMDKDLLILGIKRFLFPFVCCMDLWYPKVWGTFRVYVMYKSGEFCRPNDTHVLGNKNEEFCGSFSVY